MIWLAQFVTFDTRLVPSLPSDRSVNLLAYLNWHTCGMGGVRTQPCFSSNLDNLRHSIRTGFYVCWLFLVSYSMVFGQVLLIIICFCLLYFIILVVQSIYPYSWLCVCLSLLQFACVHYYLSQPFSFFFFAFFLYLLLCYLVFYSFNLYCFSMSYMFYMFLVF